MKHYNKHTKEFIYTIFVENEQGTYFLDGLSKEQKYELGILEVVDPIEPLDPRYQEVRYEVKEKQYVGKIYNTKTKKEIDALLLNEAKSQKIKQLQEWAKQMAEECKVDIKGFGIVQGGYKYLINAQAVAKNYLMLPEKVFRMYDNSFKPITQEQAEMIPNAIEFAGILLHHQKWGYEHNISVVESIEQLNEIVFSATIEIAWATYK